MKVLVIQPKIGMGDMIIYLPYIHAISKKYNQKISVLVKSNSRADELLKDDNHIDEILFLNRSKDGTGEHDGIKGFFNLVKLLKLKNFDKIFIFNSSLRYFLIAKAAGIKKIVQYPLFKKKDNIVTSAKILTENDLGTIVSTQPELILNDKQSINIKNKFSKEYKHICVGISASGPTKRWDVKNYIKLCEKIYNIYPSKFYIAGGTKDKYLIDEFMQSSIGSSCYSFSNLKISETLPLIKKCDIYIGNDTGWLHISAALGVKSLALFMDSPVLAYGKYSNNISVVVPEGETEETTTHNTLGKEKISFQRVFEESKKLIIK